MPAKAEKRPKSKTKRALSRIESQKRRQLIRKLRYIQGWTFAEISEKLEINMATVQRDINKIKKELIKEAPKVADEIKSIISEIKGRHQERIKILFNELVKLEIGRAHV